MIRSFISFSILLTTLVSCDFTGGVITKPGQADSVAQSGKWGHYVVNYPLYDNSFVDSLVRDFTDSLVTGFKPLLKYAVEDKMKYEMEVNYKEYFAKPGIVSVVFNIYQFTGGAHGNTFIESIVIDSKNNRRLGLNDLLTGNEFKEVQLLTRKKLKKMLEYNESVDQGTASPDDFSSFAVTDDKYIFWFSPYQVASYADGLQKVEITRH